jgi:hypothetical protein
VAGLNGLAAVKPADLVVKAVDFADLSDPKGLAAGAEPKALPPVPADVRPE